jgi:hypothetical protein
MTFQVPKISKPFENYKWRWMEYTPVESFNRPDILIGITRAIHECEGQSASDQVFLKKLEHIQTDLLKESEIRLVPTDPTRNVLRRQGRYWRGLGLLEKQSTRSLKLTEFGEKYANGSITNDDFIASIIKSHEIPNALIESDETLGQWKAIGLKIKPLELILNVITELVDGENYKDCYLTPDELTYVIIPLAIISQDSKYLSKAILEYRLFPEKFLDLPNCAPESNDKRMVREHLMLLSFYGILRKVDSKIRNRFSEKYYLNSIDFDSVKDILLADGYLSPVDVDINNIVPVHYAPITIRTRKLVEITSRPNQAKFRKALLANFNGKCLISGEVVNDVLIACHIHEVKDGGSDHSDNGIVLRADLHILFDKNKLRISQAGDVVFSPDIAQVSAYHSLPSKVVLPKSVNLDLVRRRFEYGRVVLPNQDDEREVSLVI